MHRPLFGTSPRRVTTLLACLALAAGAAALTGCGGGSGSKNAEAPETTPAGQTQDESEPSGQPVTGEARKREEAYERELRQHAAGAGESASRKHHRGGHRGGHHGGGHKGGHHGSGTRGGKAGKGKAKSPAKNKPPSGESAAERSARSQFGREEASEAAAAKRLSQQERSEEG